VVELPYPYLLFLGDSTEKTYAKTAFGLRDWASDRCIGEWSCAGATVSTGLPRLTPQQAKARGAQAMVIGVANMGGIITDSWLPSLVEALESGLDLISGMHAKLARVPPLKQAAERHGRRLIDIRTPPANIPIATGRKRSGKRLLSVGTDCALGKKYTALALARAFEAREIDVDFRGTGQTGIMISGFGIPMDAVIADVIVVCHQPGRIHVMGHPGYELPSIEETIDLNLRLGSRTNPAIRCGGVSLDTSHLGLTAARDLMAAESDRLSLPVADPMRGGEEFDALIDACLVESNG
jgi:uncharacterized NAD-dependent epimerase/dehydratase family protein